MPLKPKLLNKVLGLLRFSNIYVIYFDKIYLNKNNLIHERLIMKIAFTSCMSATAYPNQPVWKTIQAQNPDILVLLGDSIYNDCPHISIGGEMVHPKKLSDDAFCNHMHDLYKQQLAVPEFKELIGKLPIYAIWDDHDFLWNDADAKDSNSVHHRGKAYYSSQLFKCWQDALLGKPFPTKTSDPRVQSNYKVPLTEAYDDYMPAYQKIKLSAKKYKLKDDVILHLTNGRSWRKGDNLLGAIQAAAIEDFMDKNANAIHLLASGSNFSRNGNQGWTGYSNDYAWLMKLTDEYRTILLSGDIHRNEFSSYQSLSKKQYFYDATSSGAAIDFLRMHSNGLSTTKDKFNYSEHFGMLDIHADGAVQVSFFDHGIIDFKVPSFVINNTFTNSI
jgi:alkaline phosphatase D